MKARRTEAETFRAAPSGRLILAADGCASTSSDPAYCYCAVWGPASRGERRSPCSDTLVWACSCACYEYFISTQIYAQTGILTHNFLDLAGEHRAVFSIVLTGNQIADSGAVAIMPSGRLAARIGSGSARFL